MTRVPSESKRMAETDISTVCVGMAMIDESVGNILSEKGVKTESGGGQSLKSACANSRGMKAKRQRRH